MRSLRLAPLFVFLLVPAPLIAQIAPGPYYARGDFFCSTALQGTPDSCWGYDAPLQLFDDGLHDDGAAGDGVYGASVRCNQLPGQHEFKIANADWTFNAPSVSSAPLVNGRLFTSAPDEWVHFRLDTSPAGYGWQPAVSVSNDHAYPPGAILELIGSAPELGAWASGLPVDHDGPLWSRLVTIANPGLYFYMFRVEGVWGIADFGVQYNNPYSDFGTFVTSTPNANIVIQFNELTGRIRAIDDANVAARTHTWGHLKAAYR